MKNKLKRIIGEYWLVIFAFLIYFIWSLLIPYDNAPDEAMRYDIHKYIFVNGKIPHGGDPLIRNQAWGISYAFSPILSSIIGSVFMKLLYFVTKTQENLYLAARFFSVLCSVGTVYFTIKISEKIFEKKYRILFVSLIALLPQFVFISSYINNDSIAILSTSAIVYFWIKGIESKWNLKSCAGLAISLSLAALSYYNIYGYILCSIFLFFISNAIQKNELSSVIKKAGFITILVLFLAGWWFLRNYIIYDGDIFALGTLNKYSEMYALDFLKPSNRKTSYKLGHTLSYMLINREWIKGTILSFIGYFGGLSIKLYDWMYKLYESIFLMAVFGVLCDIIKKEKKNYKHKRMKFLVISMLIIAMVITIFLSIYYSYFSDFQPQGRYVLPILVPLMGMVTFGIGKLEDLIKCIFKIDVKFRYIIPITMVIMISVIMSKIIIPCYY